MTPQLVEIEFYFIPEACACVILKFLYQEQNAYTRGVIQWHLNKLGKVAYHRNVGLFAYLEDANESIDCHIMQAIKVLPPKQRIFYKTTWSGGYAEWCPVNIEAFIGRQAEQQ